MALLGYFVLDNDGLLLTRDEASSTVKKTTFTTASAADQPVRFLFVIGLEGTGHHLMSRIVKESPAMRRLSKLKMLDDLRGLHTSMYYFQTGLLDSFCGTSIDTNAKTASMARRLRAMAAKLGNETLDVAMNANGYSKMISYPAGGVSANSCGRTKHPSLDLIYQACDQAGVRCEHLYLRRDPYDIIASTTLKRPFNPTIYKAYHLYAMFLNVIYAQLAIYAPRTAGCLDLFAGDNPMLTSERGFMGWTSTDAYQSTLDQLFTRPTPLPEEYRAQLTEARYQPYRQAMLQMDRRVWRLCQQQAESNYGMKSQITSND